MRQRATRREAIVEAMIRVAGSKGYPATSVADVIAEARASRTTFYKHFEDKEDCFLTAFDTVAERIAAEARAGCDGRGPSIERARCGLTAVVELLATEPELARVAVLEAVTAGAEARRHQWAAIGRLARMLDAGQKPAAAKLPENTALMAVGSVVGLLLDQLRGGGPADPVGSLPELEFALLTPLVGPRAAVEAYATSGAGASA